MQQLDTMRSGNHWLPELIAALTMTYDKEIAGKALRTAFLDIIHPVCFFPLNEPSFARFGEYRGALARLRVGWCRAPGHLVVSAAIRCACRRPRIGSPCPWRAPVDAHPRPRATTARPLTMISSTMLTTGDFILSQPEQHCCYCHRRPQNNSNPMQRHDSHVSVWQPMLRSACVQYAQQRNLVFKRFRTTVWGLRDGAGGAGGN